MKLRLLTCAALLAAAGCGGGGIKVVPVSGTVTLDGKPLPNVHVLFQPLGTQENPNPGPGSHAITDKNGWYVLRLASQQSDAPGAVVARHKVVIATVFRDEVKVDPNTGSADGLPPPTEKERIPAQYNAKSTLTFVVEPGGTDKADFPLTSKPYKP